MLKSIMGIFIASIVMANLCPPAVAETYNGIRCGTWLVDLGTSRYEVRHKCGRPADIEKSSLEIVEHYRIIPGTYRDNGGSIYDYFTTSADSRDFPARDGYLCDDHDRLTAWYYNLGGMARTDPWKRMTINRTIVNPSYDIGDRFFAWRCVRKTIDIERYIYNPGTTGFLRFFTFENGVLVRIETGERGF